MTRKAKWYGWTTFPRSRRVALTLATIQALACWWTYASGDHLWALFFAAAFGQNITLALSVTDGRTA